MRNFSRALGCMALLALGAVAMAEQRMSIVQAEGFVGPGSGGDPITTVNAPFVNALNQVGFTGTITRPAGTDNFVWFDAGITWTNSMGAGLSGAEGGMGIGNAGQFIYSPSAAGADAVVTNGGFVILADGMADPLIAGNFNSFDSRPTMSPNGQAWWVGGYSTTSGGATIGRYLATWHPGSGFGLVLRSGDVYAGFPVTASGVGFDYDVSMNNSHWMDVAITSAPVANDNMVIRDGIVIAQEGLPATGGTGNWQAFRSVCINNSGETIFMGDTSSAVNDDFIATNGVIQVMETDTVAWVPLGGQATRLASINNTGLVAHLWGATTASKLFLGSSDHLLASRLVVQSGSLVDSTGDYVPEYEVVEVQGSMTVGPNLVLDDAGTVWTRSLIKEIGTGIQYEAIVGYPLARPGDANDDGEIDLGDFDLLALAFGSVPGDANWNPDVDFDFNGVIDLGDFDILAINFGT